MKKAEKTERLMNLFDQMTEEQKDEMITQAKALLEKETGKRQEEEQ